MSNTDTADNAPETNNEINTAEVSADESTVAEMASEQPTEAAEVTEAAEAPEWLQSKYVTEGKSQEESIAEQAKAYNELSGKFGAFTGAPEEYTEVALSEELQELGVVLDNEDPMLAAAKEFAKDSNMSQEGLEGLVNLYAMQQVAEQKALTEYKEEQLKGLGANANSRIKNIQQWAGKNLDAETVQGLEGMATSAESVKAIERLISMTRGQAVDPSEANNNSGASAEDVSAMQFEKDQHGNRRINTDPEFRARYTKLRNEVHGLDDHKTIVGG